MACFQVQNNNCEVMVGFGYTLGFPVLFDCMFAIQVGERLVKLAQLLLPVAEGPRTFLFWISYSYQWPPVQPIF